MEEEGRSYGEGDRNALAIDYVPWTCDARNRIQHAKHSYPNSYESDTFVTDSLSRKLLGKNLF